VAELNLILMGPPGAGKGTQAERLVDDFDLPYYATGDILRAERQEGTELGKTVEEYLQKGDLVPDELIIEKVVIPRIDAPEAEDGFLLDGFPRTLPQAEALDSAMARLKRELTAVLSIEVPDDEIVRRLSGRRICTKKGHVYHVEFDPPKHEGFCDQDGSPLVQRDDDKPDTVRHRLEVFHNQTKSLLPYYGKRGLLRSFDGTRPPEEVHGHIRATLATLKLEDEL
jgi:adenylate kinase